MEAVGDPAGFERGVLGELEREGVDAVLVGESLMRAPDPARALDALLDGDQRYRD